MAVNTNPSTSEKFTSPGSAWLWQVTGLALFLGLLLGTTLRAQQNFKRDGVPVSRYGVPRDLYAEIQKRNSELSVENTELNAEKDKLIKAVDSGSNSRKIDAMQKELQDAREFGGLTPIVGPGVQITMRDSTYKMNPSWPYAQEDYIIHDRDIFFVVNELRAAGAEAIAINDQRLTATSAIRCEGPTVRVNYTQVGMPLHIRAIGDPVALSSGLQMANGVLDPNGQLAFLKMAALARADKLTLPPFAGPTEFRRGTAPTP